MWKAFRFIGMIVWSVPIISGSLHADTTYISGHITSSNWIKSNSPYIVTGDVYVDSQVTLTIDSGVEIKIDSMKSIIIYGTLNAIGTETDSIIISALDTTKRWSRLCFKPDAVGHLTYCRIERASLSAIYDSLGSSLLIEHNTITDNLANSNVWYYGGGGICCYEISPIIRNNTITNNHTTKDGGGIRCHDGSPIISNNTISYNSAGDEDQGSGGGTYCSSGSPTISGNIISNNSCTMCGGGIVCGSEDTVKNNVITNNFAENAGGGINCGGSCVIIDNVITNNISDWGGGIRIVSSPLPPIIKRNAITGNWASKGGSIWLAQMCYYEGPQISHNTISDTSLLSICFLGALDGQTVIMDSNNIYTTHFAIYNDDTLDVNARYNYWGTASKDTIAMKIWDFYDDPARGIVYYEPFLTDSLVFGIEEDEDATTELLHSKIKLEIHPNPVCGKSFSIKYDISEKSNISIALFDISGRFVKNIYSGVQEKGHYINNVGNKHVCSLPMGIYFIKLKTDNLEITKKLVLM